MLSDQRVNGILLPLSSLPSPYGIGTLGQASYDFIDFLAASHVSLWQMLPLAVTSYGDSPYQSPSAIALNYYFIDLDTLVSEGLLTEKEIRKEDFGSDPLKIDYGKLFYHRIPLLKKAFGRFDREDPDFVRFEKEGTYRDFAFFLTLKEKNGYRPWYDWPEELRHYSFVIEKKTIQEDKDAYLFYVWTQYEFLRQYRAMKAYANKKGISLVGDMPLYLARDSVEAYKYPEMFLFDKEQNPTLVAGCPPDSFSADGQLWGNPIYDWDFMQKSSFVWFNNRIRYNLAIFDILRIDHFRGLAGYYVIPFGLKTARVGLWRKGPGVALFKDKKDLPIIAEDLGFIDQPVLDLLKATGYPGMKILEFAFDGNPKNDHKPSNTPVNYVAYTGTHDNEPIYGYLKNLSPEALKVYEADVKKECELAKVPYADKTLKDLAWTTVTLCYAEKAFAAVLPLQDLLLEDDTARINKPSTLGNNWLYRASKKDFTPELSAKIKGLVETYKRG